MAINWALGLGAPNAGEAFMQGWQTGGTKNALSRLATNPNDAGAVNALAQFNPQAAMQVRAQQQESQQAAARQDILRRAYEGDKSAMAEAFGFDPDLVMKLDDNTKGQLKQSVDFISNAALQIDRLPEAQRGQAWAEYVRLAESRGMDIPAEYEQYSPQVLQAAIAEAGMVSKLLEGRDPRYQVIPEGGMLVNTRDPSALAQVGAPTAQQSGLSEDQAAPIIAQAQRSKVISPEDFAAIQQSLGPNGQEAARQWMQQNGIEIGKQVGGNTYVQRGGDWYEVN